MVSLLATTMAMVFLGCSGFQKVTVVRRTGSIKHKATTQSESEKKVEVLKPEVEEALRTHLTKSKMLRKVAAEAKCQGTAQYTGIVFEPKPYSIETPRGCPLELESYLENDRFIVINVPPVIMFKAKCFKPSKLCAIYELDHDRTVGYMLPSTAGDGAVGFLDFDFGSDEEFKDQIV